MEITLTTKNDFAVTFVKDLEGFTGTAKLWKVEPFVEYEWSEDLGRMLATDHVVTSATRSLGEPETYAFPATPEGEVLDWGELPGSINGVMDHFYVIEHLDHVRLP